MSDMLVDFYPSPESRKDPCVPMGGKMRSDAWYKRPDGKFEHILMFSIDYAEAFERNPESRSDGASADIWKLRGHPDHWIEPPPDAKVIDRRDAGGEASSWGHLTQKG